MLHLESRACLKANKVWKWRVNAQLHRWPGGQQLENRSRVIEGDVPRTDNDQVVASRWHHIQLPLGGMSVSSFVTRYAVWYFLRGAL